MLLSNVLIHGKWMAGAWLDMDKARWKPNRYHTNKNDTRLSSTIDPRSSTIIFGGLHATRIYDGGSKWMRLLVLLLRLWSVSNACRRMVYYLLSNICQNNCKKCESNEMPLDLTWERSKQLSLTHTHTQHTTILSFIRNIRISTSSEMAFELKFG